MGSQRVWHDWSDLAAAAAAEDWLSFLGGASGKERTCQCRRHKRCWFDPWLGKIPRSRAWPPTPVFLHGESSWTEESADLQSMGSQRVGHDWATEWGLARSQTSDLLNAGTFYSPANSVVRPLSVLDAVLRLVCWTLQWKMISFLELCSQVHYSVWLFSSDFSFRDTETLLICG